MSLWMKIAMALPLVLMLVVLAPQARRIVAASRPAEAGDWRAFVLPLAVVVGFVLLLMQLVR